MHRQFYTDTVGPGSKDHLALMTVFACTVGWSLKPGFTVCESTHMHMYFLNRYTTNVWALVLKTTWL